MKLKLFTLVTCLSLLVTASVVAPGARAQDPCSGFGGGSNLNFPSYPQPSAKANPCAAKTNP